MNGHRFGIDVTVIALLLGLLMGCGSRDREDGGTPVAADVSGVWIIHEEIDDRACGGTGSVDDYTVTVTQEGASITVVAPAGTFHGSVNGNTISWTGQYYEASDNGYVTITSMSLTVSGASLSGSARWDFRNTASGPVECSGTTDVSGTRVNPGATAPIAPSGLSAESLSESSIRLSWTDNSDNEAGFDIERAANAQGPFTPIGTVNAGVTQYTDTGLTASTGYHYRVHASNGDGDSPYSNTASATTLTSATTAPAAPSQLSSTGTTATSVSLTWIDNSTNEQGFQISRATSSTGLFSQIATTTSNQTTYTNFSLNAATTYYYRVVAYNSAGDSAPSNTLTVSTSSVATVLAAPTNLTATVNSSSSITLGWTDNANNETGYKIERGPASTGPFTQIATVGADAQAYTNIGLTAATAYSYRVRATNVAGDSGYSNVSSATTSSAATLPPAPPSNATVGSITASSAIMSWRDNATNEAGFDIGTCTGLVSEDSNGVYRCPTDSIFTVIRQLAPNATSVSLTGLSASTMYSYFVRAYNSGGASDNVGVRFTTASLTQTVTLNTQYDNLVMHNSTISATQNTVYQTGELAVGCNWTYGFLQDFVCAQGLVRFDLSTLSGRTIDSATLKLTVNYRGVGSYPRNWHIRAQTTSWAPATVTWNVVEASQYYSASEIIKSPPTYSGQVYNIDVRSIVQNWVNGTWFNNGLVFGSHDYAFPYATSLDAFAFYSREDTGGGGPKLVVTFR